MTPRALSRFAFTFLTLVLCAGFGAPAHASLSLCNRTSYVLYAATAETAGTEAITRGWTRIVPGTCASAIPGPLAPAGYEVYARTSRAHRGPAHDWGGTDRRCVKDTDFSLKLPGGSDRCPSDDSFAVPFAPVETKGQANWTTTFTHSPAIASLAAARDAGIARLLSDIGFKPGAGGSWVSAALTKFRLRMRLPPDANSADLFDALETEAMKVAAPAGYSICNDSDAPFWAALGENAGKTWRAHGWWQVMPGACAHAITQPLSADKIYLLAERKDGVKLVTGRENFCVTNITFEVEGREHCAQRGLKAVGFATTGTKGRSGFVAHVGENGLLPSLGAED